MSRIVSLFSTTSVVLLAVCLASVPAFPSDSGCQPVFDAMSKVLTTPAHIYTTKPSGSRPADKAETSELIYFGGAIYVKTSGKWTRSRMTAQQMLDQEKENQEHGTATCRYLRQESVNSAAAAAVYAVHSENEDVKSDGTVWISGKGLPLREEMDIDVDDPAKTHHSIRFEYGNVQAPPV
jgi:hypothetical protein